MEQISFLLRVAQGLDRRGYFKHMPDKTYLKMFFRLRMKKKLNLKHPVTFNEKLQWLKLYNRKPEYTMMVDKYEVKKYVADLIGEEYLIPTLGVWDSVDDIDFSALPNSFVLKCTHDSGGIVLCKNKAEFDIEQAKKQLQKNLDKDYYMLGREWPYKNVKRRIIAEAYMEDSVDSELRDYKFFCFNSEVKAMFIASDRTDPNLETKFDFFDENANHLPFTNGHPNAATPPRIPQNFNKMKELASVLSKDMPHARIDFYEVDGQVYFGEITFFHWSGFSHFSPIEWDKKFGEYIDLTQR